MFAWAGLIFSPDQAGSGVSLAKARVDTTTEPGADVAAERVLSDARSAMGPDISGVVEPRVTTALFCSTGVTFGWTWGLCPGGSAGVVDQKSM
jgi:hypothetical protein